DDGSHIGGGFINSTARPTIEIRRFLLHGGERFNIHLLVQISTAAREEGFSEKVPSEIKPRNFSSGEIAEPACGRASRPVSWQARPARAGTIGCNSGRFRLAAPLPIATARESMREAAPVAARTAYHEPFLRQARHERL